MNSSLLSSLNDIQLWRYYSKYYKYSNTIDGTQEHVTSLYQRKTNWFVEVIHRNLVIYLIRHLF